jgi:2-iminobutanoate/2-iminopropanoate deaminase
VPGSVKFGFDNPSAVPAPLGRYSHVARLELGDGALLLVSGQIAVDDDGELVGGDSMSDQSERVFELLGSILDAHGAGFDDVVSLRSFLTDMERLGDYRTVRTRHMTGEPPTSTTVEVSGLVVPGALVEVELMAVVR